MKFVGARLGSKPRHCPQLAAAILKVSTLQRRLVAIRECHRYGGFELDTSSVAFRDTWKGLRREESRARPVAKKAPLMTATLRRAVRALPGNLIGDRDRECC